VSVRAAADADLALLPIAIPQLGGQQLAGTACAWCAAPLADADPRAVDIGERPDRPGLRGCRRCVYHAALGQLHTHALACPGCRVGDAAGGTCPTGLTLARFMREYW
jgi:hypothetical protein